MFPLPELLLQEREPQVQALLPVQEQIPAGGTSIEAPMPGTIMSVNVAVGDSVNEGDVVCILEAMKMENEIVAPKAGKVSAVNTDKGQNVNTGDVLIVIE